MTKFGNLYMVASPFEGELPTSWLFRTAELHGVTVQELFQIFGLPGQIDPDIEFSSKHVDCITQGISGNFDDIYLASAPFSFVKSKPWLRKWLRKNKDNQHVIGFCPQCLEEGIEPYFRGVWRFRFWTVCDRHNRKILDSCTLCGAPLRVGVYTSNITLNLSSRDLAHCRFCTKSLYFFSGFNEQLCPEKTKSHIELQRAITSALIQGRFQLRGLSNWLPLEFLPSFLLLGVVAGKQEVEGKMDLMMKRAIRAALRNYEDNHARGFFTGTVSDYVADRQVGVWKGDADMLAEIVINERFKNGNFG